MSGRGLHTAASIGSMPASAPTELETR
jgi:hypothetical protein